MTAAPDIFLSYNREDAAIAKAYADAFAREGLEVWWDAALKSGEAYDEVTEEALRQAKAVVVLWSPRSVGSRWVRAEATVADRNKTLMPVTIEPCNRPVMFELTQTVELSHWRGAAEDKAWLAFLSDVRRMVGREAPAAPAPASVPAASAGSGMPVVAVLPLTHRAGDEEMEELAEDLTEEITRELAQSPFFKMIASSTMAAWRGKAIDNRALGQELEANYLIECKLQRTAETVRLTAQVIDAATGSMLRSNRIARSRADIAASPEEFLLAVSAELGEQIAQIEMNRAMTKPGPLSGWEHVLRARAYSRARESDSTRRSIEEARHAVAAAPDLGLAHAMLSAALAAPVSGEGEELDEAVSREIQAHARRAMQLDGENPAVIADLITGYTALGDGESCLRLARRLTEIQPNSPSSHYKLFVANLSLGRTADAIAVFTNHERLLRLQASRLIALTYVGMCYVVEGQPVEAEAALDQALALHPDFHIALKWKAIVAAECGEERVALATVRRLREVEPAMSIDKHVWQIDRNPHLAKRSIEAVATLRRLWDATGGGG